MILQIRQRMQLETAQQLQKQTDEEYSKNQKLSKKTLITNPELQRLLQSVQRESKHSNVESVFNKVITGDKGITFDGRGAPLMYRRPPVKDNAKSVNYYFSN